MRLGIIFDRTPSFVIELEDAATEFSDMIARDDYSGDQATIDVHRMAVEHLVGSARKMGIDGRFMSTIAALMDQVVAGGGGTLEMASVFRVIRGTGHSS